MVSAVEYICTLLLLTATVSLRLDGVGGAPMRAGIGDGGGTEGCRRNLPELRECVSTAVQQFVNFMSSGKISPKHSITPFDPLYLPNMTIFQEKQVKAVYVNRYLVGLKNAFIQDVSADLEKLEFNVTTLMPALEMLGLFATKTFQDHPVTENSILTLSIRNTLVNFVAKGALYSMSDANGTSNKYLRLQVGINQISMGSYVLSGHLDNDRHLTEQDRSAAPAKFMRLIGKDLRMQLAKRIEYIANEALAVTPFVKLFPI
ncbi:uncharacterized protein LOC128714896 [Anopheles marshallii]|uniref:uncharacterized protein LOC128714896 n=1 Tax=Anopheles marshallii TaxID=1521116 RepID=UPI00237AF21E|nr:uncharacterized protein LOC128714896 [Anopheles marshallii]